MTTTTTPTEAEQRAASMARHPAGRRLMTRAVVALAAAGLLATGTGVGTASAAPSPQSQRGEMCHQHPDVCVNEYDRDYRPGWSMVDPRVLRNGGHLTLTQRIHGFENEVLDALANAARRIRRLA